MPRYNTKPDSAMERLREMKTKVREAQVEYDFALSQVFDEKFKFMRDVTYDDLDLIKLMLPGLMKLALLRERQAERLEVALNGHY